MDRIPARFTPVSDELLRQLDTSVLTIREQRAASAAAIRRARARAVNNIKRRSQRMREILARNAERELREQLILQQSESHRQQQSMLEKLRVECRTVALKVLAETVRQDHSLAARAICTRIDTLLGIIGRQSQATLTVNPREAVNEDLLECCRSHSLALQGDNRVVFGDFSLTLPAGRITSSLGETLERSGEQLVNDTVEYQESLSVA